MDAWFKLLVPILITLCGGALITIIGLAVGVWQQSKQTKKDVTDLKERLDKIDKIEEDKLKQWDALNKQIASIQTSEALSEQSISFINDRIKSIEVTVESLKPMPIRLENLASQINEIMRFISEINNNKKP